MENWNGLDFFIFLIFFVNTMHGMSRGATKEIISLMCLSVALIFTIRFTVPLTHFLNQSPSINNVLSATPIQNFMSAIGADPLNANFLNELSYSISVLICFVGIFSIAEAVLVSSFSEMFTFPYAVWNRKVGAALGATRGYVISVIFIMIFGLHIFKNNDRQIADQFMNHSYFIGLFRGTAEHLDSLISDQQVTRYQEIYRDRNLFNEQSIQNIAQPSGIGFPNIDSNNPSPQTPQRSISSQPSTEPQSNTPVLDQLQRNLDQNATQ